MSELDIKALRQHRDKGWPISLSAREVHAIVAALEDRERLRETLRRIDAVVERMYLPPEFAHFQAELSRILTLEGRDG